ncbi:MAG: hypothetical protein GF417_08920 [Candidatus Latescibacteria bacterium]|nr:hypothetical protein [Candidatus Latescibacterota bacterium]
MVESEIIKLFVACTRLAGEFAPPGRDFSERELIRSEARRTGDIILIINHLSAMAQILHRKRASSSMEPHDIEQTAVEIITPFFMRRGGRGPFELVHVIHNFFERNENPEAIDIFYYLRGAVGIRYANYNRKKKKFEDPEYINTGRNIDAYVARSSRFRKDKYFIMDSYVDIDSKEGRLIQQADIMRICGARVSPGDSIPAIIDKLFDCLADSVEFFSRVERETLTASILEMKNSQNGIPLHNYISPMEDFISMKISEISTEVSSQLRNSYKLRKNFTTDETEAIFKAVEDYLYDLGVKEPKSLREYLQPHIDGCSADEYRNKFKGCQQNLVLRARELWIEKVRCIPGLLYHLKGEFNE